MSITLSLIVYVSTWTILGSAKVTKDSFQETRYDTWREIVTAYTKRFLTVSSDRLPALAGIAVEFEAALENRYLYGLWANDLHRGLLFCELKTKPSQSSSANPTWESAPSWSWAPLNKPITWYYIFFPTTRTKICMIEESQPGLPKTLCLSGYLLRFSSSPYRSLDIGREHKYQGFNANGPTMTFKLEDWYLTFLTSQTPLIAVGAASDNLCNVPQTSVLIMPILSSYVSQSFRCTGWLFMHRILGS